MIDYIRLIVRKKPDTILLHVWENDLTKGTNTMKNITKYVEALRELDNSENIQVCFSNITHRSDKDFSKEISELNVKMKKYWLCRGISYVDEDNINESCLNNSRLHLNKKDTNLFSKNISTSLDVTWNASTDTMAINNSNHIMKKRHKIDQVLSDLQSFNLSNLNFCYFNITQLETSSPIFRKW